MTAPHRILTCVLAAVVSFGGSASAQETAAPQPGDRNQKIVPLKLLVVVSKYQGDKKVSSLPYTLTLSSNGGRVSLRMGGEVPILTGGTLPGQPASFNYRNVGTSIDCAAAALDADRFSINIGLEDSSVYAEGAGQPSLSKTGDHPSFNTFKANETVILKDGQSSQYTTAADKVTGEVIKVDLTLTVVK
jgi:Flp pilus assembly secretin CpaC